jgi:hypothetical protein
VNSRAKCLIEHLREEWNSKKQITYVQVLMELSKDVRAEREGTALKMAVRETLEGE